MFRVVHPAARFFGLVTFPFLQLVAEASRVADLRLRMMALGKASPDEMLLMVTEKIEAFERAGHILVGGGSASHVVDNYRKIVAANLERLSGR